MTLKEQENIRRLAQLSYLGSNVAMHFVTDNINVYNLNYMLSALIATDILLIDRTENKTEEYKKLKSIYENIINNTITFMKEIGAYDPVSIFATYVYMYRNGYLSVDKKFIYSAHMKDFFGMGGIDVIRGQGVCRSLANMLTDIYKCYNYDTSSLAVNTSLEAVKIMDEESFLPLCEKDISGEKLSKIIGSLTTKIRIGNHLITQVRDNNVNYILDPTHNGILKYVSGNKIAVMGHDEGVMTYKPITQAMTNFIGTLEGNIMSTQVSGQLKMPTISKEEYNQKYIEMYNTCVSNSDFIEKFYSENSDLYKEISEVSNKQKGLVKRMITIIP